MLRIVLLAPLFCLAIAGAQEKSPKSHLLENKRKDIHVLSDRDENVVSFFQRQRLMAGALQAKDFKALLESGKAKEKVFLNYTSRNDDRKEQLFGSFVTLAPMSKDVAKLLEKQFKDKDGMVAVLCRIDPEKKGVVHLVGFTERTNVGFFVNDKHMGEDGFGPADLEFVAKKK